VLVCRRDPDAHQGDLWEFPGGKIDATETPLEAAQRELREETGLDGGSWEPLVLVVHDYADRPVRLHVFLAVDPVGDLEIEDQRAHDWVSPQALAALQMPEANRQILRALRWRLQ
jgi:8-oxo-dGTP diphosphatase